ncbi:hypothetical protein [Psychrobacter celer]|uniref:hypothetical protein n=1 Tax=Psychrobacter celer TaxID=306572 RepID=UPI003FD39482
MRQSRKFLEAIDISSYRRYLQQMFITVGLLLFSLVSVSAYANPFATNIPASGSNACPSNHKMYYIGTNAPTSTQEFPVVSLPLNWTTGNSSRNFTFTEASGNKTFNINFSSILDKNNSEGNPPVYGSINGSTSSAINLVHNSTSTINNHILNISINRSVSKAGYEIQDVDSLTSNVIVGYGSFLGFPYPIYGDRTPYAEQVDVSANGGRLTFNSLFHTANNPAPNTSIVTAIEGQNCSTGECNIDASWGYKAANSVLGLRHNNTINETSAPHAVGYSNFYFCLAPPKVLVKKVLAGNRVNDSDTNRDQFELSINRGTTVVNAVTTTGSGSAVTNNNNRNAVSIAENTSYTITEKVRNGANGTTLGEIANYNASYTCTNATTGSTTVMPTAAMSYNQANKTRSFTLSNAAFGDEITCTITNTPIDNYTFTGYVFNDNGGLSGSPKNDLTNSFINTYKYFNGVFDNGESGIDGSALNNLKVRLTDCNSTDITGTTPQNVSDTGSYSFTVPASAVAGKSQVCLIQEEPDPWSYSVDTTPNRLEVPINNSVYLYEDNNFGEVIAEQTALVLKKYQYVHQCDANLNYNNILDKDSPLNGFSINAPRQDEKVDPGQCIAYKIEAYNHGHITLTDIRITDILQKTPVESVFHLPNFSGIAASLRTTDNPTSGLVNIGDNGVIITEPFNLNNTATTTTVSKRTLYFNTKYGN